MGGFTAAPTPQIPANPLFVFIICVFFFLDLVFIVLVPCVVPQIFGSAGGLFEPFASWQGFQGFSKIKAFFSCHKFYGGKGFEGFWEFSWF